MTVSYETVYVLELGVHLVESHDIVLLLLKGLQVGAIASHGHLIHQAQLLFCLPYDSLNLLCHRNEVLNLSLKTPQLYFLLSIFAKDCLPLTRPQNPRVHPLGIVIDDVLDVLERSSLSNVPSLAL